MTAGQPLYESIFGQCTKNEHCLYSRLPIDALYLHTDNQHAVLFTDTEHAVLFTDTEHNELTVFSNCAELHSKANYYNLYCILMDTEHALCLYHLHSSVF